MGASKKKIQSFSAKDLTETLNPQITTGGKKLPGEVARLQALLMQALKEKKYNAVKQLLEAFDEAGAINASKHQPLYIVPKIFDFRHFVDSLVLEDYTPKLSKIGERELARRQADFKGEYDELRARIEEGRRIANEAAANIRSLPERLEAIGRGLPLKEISEILERQDEYVRLHEIRDAAFDSVLNAVASFNKKWRTKIKLNVPGRVAGYKRPPQHTKFKKGQSGNPHGRPSTKKTPQEVVKDFAYREISFKMNGQETTQPVIQVVFNILSLLAMTGDTRASSLRRKYLKKYDPSHQPKPHYLIVPEQVTVDEYIERLEEHRKRSQEALAKMYEDDEKLRLPSHSSSRS